MKKNRKEYPRVVVEAQLPTVVANRATDTRVDEEFSPSMQITLETIDTAIANHLTLILPTVSQDGLSVKVPVMYASPERWKTIQSDGVLRDKFDKIQLPLVVIQRTNITKASINSAVNKYNVYAVQQKYNRRNAYDKFNLQNGITPSEKYYSMMMPDYYNITYSGLIWTEFVTDMNAISEAVMFESNTYWGDPGNYRFRVKIDQINAEVDTPQSGDRMVKSSFTMEVFGYLLPQSALDDNGMKTPVTKLDYSPKKLVTFIEIVGTGENLQNVPNDEE
jgi:hypothetical protein